MNTLTKNRILQKGDEYRNNGKWLPVPDKDIGLQICFTKYTDVRRPSEEPYTPSEQGSQVVRHGSAKPTIEGSIPSPASKEGAVASFDRMLKTHPPVDLTISPDSKRPLNPASEAQSDKIATANEQVAVVTEKAEKGASTPDPIPSGSGGIPELTVSEASEVLSRLGLPVIRIDEDGLTKISAPTPPPPGDVDIGFADEDYCIWIGRNGTFRARAIRLHNTGSPDGRIQIIPIGKRGVARNALIEFPASIIPMVVDTLLRMQPVGAAPCCKKE